MTTISLIWLAASIAWLLSCVIGYFKLKARKKILDSAEKDLNLMQEILGKFKRGEVPLDAKVLEAHMNAFDSVSKQFNLKMKILDGKL